MRVATLADVPALALLETEVFPDAWPAASLRGELSQTVTRAWVLERDGAAVASLLGWLIGEEFQVNRVAVLPSRRRAGLGRALVREALAHAQTEGATRALLEVRAGNVAALRLYETLGFQQAGRRRAYYPDGEDALVLVREL